MARLIGPDESVRVVYLTSGTNKGKASAQGMSAQIYADSSLTSLASILTTTGDAIADSTVIIDAYSKLPLFQFPNGVDTVWTSINGGPAVPLYARTDDRLDTVTAAVATLDTTVTGKVPETRTITAGTGLTGGGDLSTNRTLAVAYGTTAGTAAQGNDSRLSDARVPTAQGMRLAVLGDSTARAGDSEPGIAGATVLILGDSWLTWASMLSRGKVIRAVNAGIIGDTIAMMDARVVTDVCTHVARPTACAVVSGYNDAFAGVTLAAYATSLRSVVAKLRAYGIVPILCTPLPTSNSSAIAALLAQYSLYIRRYATLNNLALLDLQAWAMDPATGGMISSIATGGDGVHPGTAGQKVLGQFVADYLAEIIPASAVSLVSSPLDTSNMVPNGLFAGSPTSGRAPSVFVSGSLPAGAVATVVTDAAVPGSMQRVTHTGSSVQCVLAQRIQASGKWSVGDRIAYSGVVTAAGVTGSIISEHYATPYLTTTAYRLGYDIMRGVFYGEAVIPPGGTTFMDLQMLSGPGTGTFDVGQLSAYNLTTLGIV